MELCTALVEGKMPLNIESNTGYTPLHIAILYGHYDLAKYFISQGSTKMRNLKFILLGANMEVKSNKSGWAVLHSACKTEREAEGYEEIMEILVSKSQDINIGEQGGLTPLDIAIEADNKIAVIVLLKYKAMSRR
jgi:ankyrin repeat protein